jgi:hypothetical protein
MMQSAPVGLIYVSDYSKMKTFLFRDDERRWFISGTDAGFISQKVYLYCAASNLNTVVLALVNRDKLHDIMDLNEREKVVYTQVIGRPPEE